MTTDSAAVKSPPRNRTVAVRVLVGVILVYLLLAYVIIPFAWTKYVQRHPAFDENPRITLTKDHHPGDPLNVGLIGTKAEVEKIMKMASWFPAAKLSLESDLKIAEDSVLSRPDITAPVSSLYLFGRKEDLAFEQPVGDNPRHRHHVRFWKTKKVAKDGRPKWIGSAVYDERIGFSHTTGEITHITAADVDAERDYLLLCLEKTNDLSHHFVIPGFHKQLAGRNGGGDPWHTDGNLSVGVIAENSPLK